MLEDIPLPCRTVALDVTSLQDHSHVPTLGAQPTSQEAGTKSQHTDVLDLKSSSEPPPASDHAVVDNVISGSKNSEVSICIFLPFPCMPKNKLRRFGKNDFVL